MINTPTRVALLSLLVAGCATESAHKPPVAPPPEPPQATEPAPEPAEADVRAMEASVEQPPPLGIAPGSEGDLLELFFPSGTADLTEDSRRRLDRLCTWLLRQGEDFYIDLQGHTDSTGSETANLQLAEHRALVVREYLHERHAVPLDRMGIVPVGSAAPVADEQTLEGRRRNRRVVVVVIQSPE